MRTSFVKFDDFELDYTRFELRRAGRVLKLEKIPIELLILLVEREGHLVPRQEIVDRLWGKDVFIDADHGINTAVRKIRSVLRDNAERPKFIQTVTGKGYRFIANQVSVGESVDDVDGRPRPVNPKLSAQAAAASTLPDPSPVVPSRRRHWLQVAAIAALAVCLFAVALLAFNVAGLRDRFLARSYPPQIQSIACPPSGGTFPGMRPRNILPTE